MPTIFTKIINREIPGHIVAEDDGHIAFLDINPNTKGHTLCVPKKEIDKILDMPEDDYMALMAFARKVGLALRNTVDCKRIGMTVIGLEVPHVHVHLIPLHNMGNARFLDKVQLSEEEFKELATAIKDNL